MKSIKYLETLQKDKNLNVSELAALLGISQPSLSNLKAGRRIMENETCLAVALQLGIDPLKIIMAADIDRAERAGQHSLWEVFSKRTAATAASVVLAVVAGSALFTPNDAKASNLGFESHPLRQYT